jgi:hypothetical protein
VAAIGALWSRALMPALVAVTVCAHLGWALHAAASLHR